MKDPEFPTSERTPFDFDLYALMHLAQAFEHPRAVVFDPDLTVSEKRAILASWASNACADTGHDLSQCWAVIA
jgi:hypothetical protein